MTPTDSEGGRGVLNQVFRWHQDELWVNFQRATSFWHSGTQGELRESAISSFLRQSLPARYGVLRGAAVDQAGQQSRQLDVMIYDRITNHPLVYSDSTGTALLPAEALLAVIEVKSSLNRNTMTQCLQNAQSIRTLSPAGKRFITRLGGGTDDRQPRCLYSLISYRSDLVIETWMESEWQRLNEVATKIGCDASFVDRIVVLDRGLIAPPFQSGQSTEEPGVALLNWYLHLNGFLGRETFRRDPPDLDRYSEGRNKTWKQLEPTVGEKEGRTRRLPPRSEQPIAGERAAHATPSARDSQRKKRNARRR